MGTAARAIFPQFQSLRVISFILISGIRSLLALSTRQMNDTTQLTFLSHVYSMILPMTPAPTVLPPSLMAKRSPVSKATG